MSSKITEKMWIKYYCEVDDLHHSYNAYYRSRKLGQSGSNPTRVSGFSLPEMCTIMVMYPLSGYKCFKYYYESEVLDKWKPYFPSAPSYGRFIELLPRCLPLLLMWLFWTIGNSLLTGYYFVDSKALSVCHIRRVHNHKVFQGLAQKGKSSMGWFFGFKIHLVINHLGQIVNLRLTSGNVADNNHTLLHQLLNGLQGICAADKGYQTALFATFYEAGLKLLVKPKRNMKQSPVSLKEGKIMRKRAVIESVFDILDNFLDIDHTRHRSPDNALCHIIANLIAYQYLPQKPHVFIKDAPYNYLDKNRLNAA